MTEEKQAAGHSPSWVERGALRTLRWLQHDGSEGGDYRFTFC